MLFKNVELFLNILTVKSLNYDWITDTLWEDITVSINDEESANLSFHIWRLLPSENKMADISILSGKE